MPLSRVFGPRAVVLAAALGVSGAAWGQKPAPVENVSSMEHRSPEAERRALHLPSGFEIQLVAAEPDIHKPLNLAFDDRGRLWVTDTLEYPFPRPDGTPGRDSVKILSNFGADGRAGKIETFADGLNIPIGVLPYPSGREALVYSIPNLYLMRDDDGDGRADVRKLLYGSIGHRDTHGMTNAFIWGFDGWIYACHGFSNTSRVQGSDHRPIEMNSGNTYRMRPDGSHVEQFTHGQVNPFGLAWGPLGNLYSCDCHSRPVYQLLRGAWYPSFGKPDDGLGFGPEMMTHDHGSTGIGGISYYAADQFPEAYRGTVFVGNVVTNRINHDRIEWHGSSPKGIQQPDFVWSEDNWFRPVDIELGPDGALYVADFYNRIIGHYEVPLTHPGRDRSSGRIWRIVYRGDRAERALAYRPVDRTKSSIDQLIADLVRPNLAVRLSAANQLVDRAQHGGKKDAVIEAVRAIVGETAPALGRVHGIWILQRLGAMDGPLRAACAKALEREVRVHNLKALVECGPLSDADHDLAEQALKDSDPFVRRAAAEALGAHPDRANVLPLIGLIEKTSADDTHLRHAARIALRDQLKTPDAWKGLIGLKLSRADLLAIADVALGVPLPESAAYLLGELRQADALPSNLERMLHHVARYGDLGQGKALAVLVGRADAGSPQQRSALIKTIFQGLQERGAQPPKAVRDLAVDHVNDLLGSKDRHKVEMGAALAGELRLKEARNPLLGIVQDEKAAPHRRSAALNALMVIDPRENGPIAEGSLRAASSPPELRESAAERLAASDRAQARQALVETIALAPDRLQTAIAVGLAHNRDGAQALLDTIAAGKASARLLQDQRVALALKQSAPPKLEERLKALLAGLPPADQKLNDLIQNRRIGFRGKSYAPDSGRPVFEKHCGVCHSIGGKGARIGPQLDGIGSRGPDRLIEDVLDPNRNVDQAFRVVNLALENGEVVSGLLLREEGEILVLADPQGKEVRVPRASVEEKKMSSLSVMPANLSDQISEDDFYRLLAFLLSKSEAAPPAAGTAGAR